MTLAHIQKILNSIQIERMQMGFDHNSFIFSNLDNFRQLIQQIETIPVAQAQVLQIKNSFIFSTVGNQVTNKSGEAWALHQAALTINASITALRETLNAIVPEQDEKTVSIKLPEERDFKEVIQDLDSLNTAISQNVINEKISGSVSVKSWQPGSLWIDIYLGSVAAVTLVGGLAWAAAVVRKKWHEATIMENIAGSMEIKNEMLENLRKGVKEHVKLTIESEAKNLLFHNFSEDDNHDQIERLKHGIKTFADLIERGAEIHPALKAPENVKNLFPNFAKLDLVESKQKLIEEKTDSKDK